METTYGTSTGITCTFDGLTFAGVFDLSWSWGTGSSAGRSEWWNSDGGGLQLSTYVPVSTSLWNTSGPLSVTGGNAAVSVPLAVCEKIECQPELNGITKYNVSFKWIF